MASPFQAELAFILNRLLLELPALSLTIRLPQPVSIAACATNTKGIYTQLAGRYFGVRQ